MISRHSQKSASRGQLSAFRTGRQFDRIFFYIIVYLYGPKKPNFLPSHACQNVLIHSSGFFSWIWRRRYYSFTYFNSITLFFPNYFLNFPLTQKLFEKIVYLYLSFPSWTHRPKHFLLIYSNSGLPVDPVSSVLPSAWRMKEKITSDCKYQ